MGTKIRTTAGRGRLYDSVLDTIGDTPCIRINALAPKGVTIYVKAEAFNPGGSVKDRLAVNIIEAAERKGTLKPGQTVVEATSGNTGIGLAMVCAQKGYPLVVTMADSFSIERRKLMRMLGAKVVLTPRAQKGFGMYQKAVELAKANGWFLAHQFETDANAEIHEATTAREIMVDANQCFTLGEALRRAPHYAELAIAWFEEPLPADDLSGHARLAAQATLPVAVGESLYSPGQFGDYVRQQACHIVQVDVARIGGITPWLKVAHLAESCNLAVAPHFLMELHVSLTTAVPNGVWLEYIPQLDAVARSRVQISDGRAVPPETPGLGIEWDWPEIERRAKARHLVQ